MPQLKIALGLEYDGSSFCGWQSQPDGCGVQDHVERALAEIAGHDVDVICAGRTDAGVHALDQVIHFETDASRPQSAWVRGVNSILPDSVAVLWAKPVADEFHARFSAIERCYRYMLLNHPVRPALTARRVGWFYQPLDVEKMHRATRCLIGEHDFSAFRAAECQARSPVKAIKRLDIFRNGDLITFEFTADGYLQHMVRNIVGSLVYVGKGKHPAIWLQSVLQSRDRNLCAPTFSAAGLYLQRIGYDDKWQLPNQPRCILFNIGLVDERRD